MGRIIKVLSFIRGVVSEIVGDPGDGANVTLPRFASPGDDSPPLKNDQGCTVKIPGLGREIVIGFLDTKNEDKAEQGEKRLYSRDDNGDVAVVVWLRKDGQVELGDPEDAVALASKTDGRLDDVRDALDAFVQALPGSSDGGAALQTAVKKAWGTGPTPDADVGSDTVKVQQ